MEEKLFNHIEIKKCLLDILLACGARKDIAEYTAEGLVHTSLRGVDSHGVRLLPHYVEALSAGRINPEPEMGFNKTSLSTGLLDADHTFGHAAGINAMKYAVDIASNSGVGVVSVKNSSHCGALAYFALMACEKDMIGMAFTHASPRVKTPGSPRPFFGTNPLCFCAPMEKEEPYCFDSAPTIMPFNKIRQYRESNMELPEGVAADDSGIETTDPFKAAQLLPMADYKGFGLTMVVDIICGLLSGMPAGNSISDMYHDSPDQKRYLGQVFAAIRIDAFENVDVFKKRLQKLCDDVRNEPCENKDNSIQVAGDPEKAIKEERIKNGIPISMPVIEKINEIARSKSVKQLRTLT